MAPLLTTATAIHALLASWLRHSSEDGTPWGGLQKAAPPRPPWQTSAGTLDDVTQHCLHWLSSLGWANSGHVEHPPHARWLSVQAGERCLHVFVTTPNRSLDIDLEAARPLDDAPEPWARREWLRRGARIGILTNGRELRVLLLDEDCQWHSVVANGQGSQYVEIGLAPDQVLTVLCSPDFHSTVDSVARQLSKSRLDDQERLQNAIRQALLAFLNDLLAHPKNVELALAPAAADGNRAASALWQGGLVLAFGMLLVARAELATTDKPREGLFATPDWKALYSPLGIRRTLPGQQANHNALALPSLTTRLKEMLRRIGTFIDLGVPTRGAVTRDLGGVAQLLELTWPEPSCRDLVEALLGVLLPKPCPGQASTGSQPLRNLELRDIAHLFESFLEYAPARARVPMARYRQGRHEVVRPLSDSNHDANVKPVETIGEGQLYLATTRGRKTTGAFYSPPALVEAVTRQALNNRLEASDGSDWAAVVELSLLDPAMGTGAFLLEAASQLGKALFERVVRQLATGTPAPSENTSSTSVPLDPSPRFAQSIAEWFGAERDSERTTTDVIELDRGLLLASTELCVERCLYGVDRNELSAVVARMALWSACGCSLKAASAVNRNLRTGNALTAPRVADLFSFPQSRQPLSEPLRQELAARLARHFSSPPDDAPESAIASAASARKTNLPLERYVTRWLSRIGSNRHPEQSVEQALIEALTGADMRLSFETFSPETRTEDIFCFELAFPERFRLEGELAAGGFDVVLGNPPWDSVKHNTREVLAGLDLRARTVTTKPERDALALELRQTGRLDDALESQIAHFEQAKRVHDRLYCHQKVVINGDLAGRQLDLFRLFLERSWELLSPSGILGMIVPSAFHTAAGAVGVRRLILGQSGRVLYAALRNTRRWFDIARGLEFGLLVAQRGHAAAGALSFRFGLQGPEQLLGDGTDWLTLPLARLLEQNPYATIAAVADLDELNLLTVTRHDTIPFADFAKRTHLELRSTPTSVHRTHEARHFVTSGCEDNLRRSLPTVEQLRSRGALLHEGATFNRYDDTWGRAPQFYLSAERLLAVPRWRRSIGYFRLVVRAIVGASEHKGIAALVAPGTLVANSALIEGAPELRPNAAALVALAVLNSATLNCQLSTVADLNVNLFALRQLPWPPHLPDRFLAHAALRLVTNHPGFLPLWEEQLGPARHPSSFPALPDPAERTRLLGAIDATVAMAYGLSRHQYQRVVARFGDDRSFGQGLNAFDELASWGPTEFYRRYDPFDDLALRNTLPEPLLSP